MTTVPPVPSAAFCAAAHPFLDVLCARIDCTGDHSSDGLDHWTTTPDDTTDPRRTT